MPMFKPEEGVLQGVSPTVLHRRRWSVPVPPERGLRDRRTGTR